MLIRKRGACRRGGGGDLGTRHRRMVRGRQKGKGGIGMPTETEHKHRVAETVVGGNESKTFHSPKTTTAAAKPPV
jgi:hypothetical protein